jgi:hypothetical protein
MNQIPVLMYWHSLTFAHLHFHECVCIVDIVNIDTCGRLLYRNDLLPVAIGYDSENKNQIWYHLFKETFQNRCTRASTLKWQKGSLKDPDLGSSSTFRVRPFVKIVFEWSSSRPAFTHPTLQQTAEKRYHFDVIKTTTSRKIFCFRRGK